MDKEIGEEGKAYERVVCLNAEWGYNLEIPKSC